MSTEIKPEHIHYKYGVFCQRFAVDPCNNGYAIEISKDQYLEGIHNTSQPWYCPICGGMAQWDNKSFIDK